LLALAVLVWHFQLRWLPPTCLFFGLGLKLLLRSQATLLFTFLVPLLPALSGLDNKGFPPNYLLLPLFVLGGMAAGEFLLRLGRRRPPLPELPKFYVSFLLILGISFVFSMLRWSNATLSPLALFRDTPLAPTGPRLSFGIIFPVLELALFVLSPFYSCCLQSHSDRRRILMAFLCGQSVSIAYLAGQSLIVKKPASLALRGFASDATAFGFLSSLALLLAWYLFYRFGQKGWGAFFAVVSLAGILISSTRIGFLAGALAVVLFIFSSRKKILTAVAVGSLVAGAIVIYTQLFPMRHFNFLMRVKNSYAAIEKSIADKEIASESISFLSAKRNILWRYSWECLRRFPVTGVGPGNFIFWGMASRPEKYVHHLPANQYLFLTSSTGLPGLILFLCFCFGQQSKKPWPEKCLIWAMLFSFLFNDYLWFSEIILAFWLVCSLGGHAEAKPVIKGRTRALAYLGGCLFLVIFNLRAFSALHPKSWARTASAPFDYGLYYKETEQGRPFVWTREKAGLYVYLGPDGRSRDLTLRCGAPLAFLEDRRQTVEIYWRGKLFKRAEFRDNAEFPLRVEDQVHREGFVEFRVRPAFNLSRMGLGRETRTLGIQIWGGE
jgi:hypothetical protein